MNEKDFQWLTTRVQYIDNLSKPNKQQSALLAIAGNPPNVDDLNKTEMRQLRAFMRAEKADERAAKAKTAADKIFREQKQADRKARNHRLIQQGLLFDLAGLEGADRGMLAGAVLAIKDHLERSDESFHNFKRRGDAWLAEIEAKNEKSETVPAPSSDGGGE